MNDGGQIRIDRAFVILHSNANCNIDTHFDSMATFYLLHAKVNVCVVLL